APSSLRSLLPRLLSWLFFLFMLPPPPRSPLFPYTTLFRSPARCLWAPACAGRRRLAGASVAAPRPVASLAGHATCQHRSRRSARSEEHTSELQSLTNLVCRLLLEKKKHTAQDSQSQHVSPA